MRNPTNSRYIDTMSFPWMTRDMIQSIRGNVHLLLWFVISGGPLYSRLFTDYLGYPCLRCQNWVNRLASANASSPRFDNATVPFNFWQNVLCSHG